MSESQANAGTTSMESAGPTQYESGAYLEKVPEWHAGDSPWKAAKVSQLLTRNQIEAATICDVGCGAGGVLAALRKRLASDTKFVGYDISPQAIELCRTKEAAGLRFRQGNFLTDCDENFDVILLLDVFEHVSDYLGFLEAINKRARLFVFHIPLDISVEAVLRRSDPTLKMRAQYGHLHCFTAETALATLADTGYVVKDFFYTWDAEIGGWPRPLQGLRGKLRYPLTCLIYLVEKLLFRWRPALIARLRKRYNLLVLASGA